MSEQEKQNFGYCVIEEYTILGTDGELEHSFHEWAETYAAAQHTVDYAEYDDSSYYGLIVPCGSDGCKEICPGLHSTRIKEVWPAGFSALVARGIIPEPAPVKKCAVPWCVEVVAADAVLCQFHAAIPANRLAFDLKKEGEE